MNAQVTKQGLAVVDEAGGDWLVMFPDGTVKAMLNRKRAEKAAADWFAKDAKEKRLKVGMGMTETRFDNTGDDQ